MVDVFIGIGSNLGNREENIKMAIEYLKNNPCILIEKVSSMIETEPQGGPPQGRYLNGVIKINTTLSPHELLSFLQDIEERLGRVREVKNGPRTIDLDILLYGEKIVDEPSLNIPHPRMFQRDFVLKPLFDIEPEIKELVESLKEKVKFKKHSP
jgi:2-amino-4-hydroxy-6-hydroxymethyldihydropteridine diphosphokinase